MPFRSALCTPAAFDHPVRCGTQDLSRFRNPSITILASHHASPLSDPASVIPIRAGRGPDTSNRWLEYYEENSQRARRSTQSCLIKTSSNRIRMLLLLLAEPVGRSVRGLAVRRLPTAEPPRPDRGRRRRIPPLSDNLCFARSRLDRCSRRRERPQISPRRASAMRPSWRFAKQRVACRHYCFHEWRSLHPWSRSLQIAGSVARMARDAQQLRASSISLALQFEGERFASLLCPYANHLWYPFCPWRSSKWIQLHPDERCC